MALEGTLHDMSLSDLIQIFQMGSKSGVLSLVSTTELGVIYVAGGRLVDAAVIRCPDRAVLAVHDDAVIRILLWDEPASFVFRHDLATLQRPARIANEGEWLVIESMRRRDDPARMLPYHKLGPETFLQLTPLPTGGCGVSLDINQWRVLSQISNQHNLGTIAQDTGMPYEQALRTVAELIALGVIEIAAPARPAARPRGSIQQGRQPLDVMQSIAGAGLSHRDVVAERPHLGRNLLSAVMRRVRSL
jgi:hypothetical protein